MAGKAAAVVALRKGGSGCKICILKCGREGSIGRELVRVEVVLRACLLMLMYLLSIYLSIQNSTHLHAPHANTYTHI